jgi:curved DNA-binding protein CbpA
MSAVQPSATGSLSARPLPQLLLYIVDRQLTGTLVLEEKTGEKSAVAFVHGTPTKVKVGRPYALLGEVLIELGAIRPPMLERALERQATTGKLIGDALVELMAVDLENLNRGLEVQLERRVTWLCNLAPDTVYGYYDKTDFLSSFGSPGGSNTSALPLLWRALFDFAPAEQVRAARERIGAQLLRFHPTAPIGQFRLRAEERAAVDLIRAKAQSITALSRSGVGSPDLIEKLVYCLYLTRQLDVGQPGEPVGAKTRASGRNVLTSGPPSAPPGSSPRSATSPFGLPPSSLRPASIRPGLSPAAAAFLDEVDARSLVQTDHYMTLGVPRHATATDIQVAFIALAKIWHPDRLPQEVQNARDAVTRIFARMSEAQQILTDPERRASYDASLQTDQKEEEEQVSKVLAAAQAFQRAEVLLKRNQLAEAKREAELAATNDPAQADYVGLHAWILSLEPERTNLDEVISLLDRAVSAEPENLRVRWYRGQVLKRAGEPKKAIKDFKFIIEKNPKHLDAVREVRLHDMRRAGAVSHPPDSESGDTKRTGPSQTPGKRSTMEPGADKPPSSKSRPAGGLFNKLFRR